MIHRHRPKGKIMWTGLMWFYVVIQFQPTEWKSGNCETVFNCLRDKINRF